MNANPNMLTQVNREWSSRPADERFLDLPSMLEMMTTVRAQSRSMVRNTRKIAAAPAPDNRGLFIETDNTQFAPSHWSFGQIAQLIKAPAGYLRTLPAPIAADCINVGLYKREVEETGLLVRENGEVILRAATGPNYGRIWNADIVAQLIQRFGDGRTGDFRVPGEFGEKVDIGKHNTTLYASDRDMFVFLADEDNRIEIPNRRDGKSGSLARGFFCWNSEEGSKTLGVATFLHDYTCMNRRVWGVEGFKEITLRHTSSAPEKFIEDITLAIQRYAAASASSITQAIEDARAKRLDAESMDDFLQKRFSKNFSERLKAVHMNEENRPIETLWDVNTAVTAVARDIKWQDERVDLERQGGKILEMTA